MKSLSRTARGLSAVLGLAVAASVLAPATAHAEPAPPASGCVLIICLPGLPDVPLPPLPGLPGLPGIPGLPPLPGTPVAPTATTPPAITGEAKTGKTLSVTAPVWDQGAAVTTTYQWLRDGAVVDGATGETYNVEPDDVAHVLHVVAIGKVSGLLGPLSPSATGTSVSEPVTPTKGAAPVPTVKPKISGTPAIGSPLTVSSGTWADPQPTFTYQWYRALGSRAAAIPGATAATYQPTSTDAGLQMVVLVLAATPGYETGFGVSDYVAVPQLGSTIRSALVTKTVAPNKRAGLRIAIAGTDGALGGKVDVFDGTRRVQTVTVPRGGSTIKLPRLTVGTHAITVVYRGDTAHRGSRSAPVRLTVRRPR